MARERGRSSATVGLLVLGVVLAVWAVRFVVGLVAGLAQVGLVAALALAGGYTAYRVWRHPPAAAEAPETSRRR